MNFIGRSYSLPELEDFCHWVNSCFVGAQLQDILTFDWGIVLVFWQGQPLYLGFDLTQNQPFPIVFEKKFPLKSGKTKPVTLFLNSHAKNKIFKLLQLNVDQGRVLTLFLNHDSRGSTQIEIRLIPRAINLLVTTGDKKISWMKPQELSQHTSTEVPHIKDLHFLNQSELWLQKKVGNSSLKSMNSVNSQQKPVDLSKMLLKKEKAVQELEDQLSEKKHLHYFSLGEKLKAEGISALESLQDPIFDLKQSLSYNLQKCFDKAKQIEKKQAGTLERIQILKAEIEKIKSGEVSQKSNQTPVLKNIFHKTEVSGRKLKIAEDLEAVFGKSAADNITLLRKANPWDLWVHLKDYPSSHAIVHRNKSRVVQQKEIKKVAEWLLKVTQVPGVMPGQKFDVVFVECRKVRPIKGDKLGRVTYHDAQQITIASTLL